MKIDMRNTWEQMEHAHEAFARLVGEFKSGDKATRLELIQKGYKNRALTMDVLEYLVPEELQDLLPFLLSHARSVHPYLRRVRQLILTIPKDWLTDNIEKAAEPLLTTGDDEEYRRLLELYIQIDDELAIKLAKRAQASTDPNIRDVGEEFMEELA